MGLFDFEKPYEAYHRVKSEGGLPELNADENIMFDRYPPFW